MSKLLFRIVLLTIIASSCKKKDTIETILTNGNEGKFWDVVYRTDIDGNLQETYYTPKNSKDSIPGSSLFFGKNNILERYSHFSADSIYITPESDVIHSKEYTVLDNKIKMDAQFYLVKSISEDSIILQSDSLTSKAFIILKAFKIK